MNTREYFNECFKAEVPKFLRVVKAVPIRVVWVSSSGASPVTVTVSAIAPTSSCNGSDIC